MLWPRLCSHYARIYLAITRITKQDRSDGQDHRRRNPDFRVWWSFVGVVLSVIVCAYSLLLFAFDDAADLTLLSRGREGRRKTDGGRAIDGRTPWCPSSCRRGWQPVSSSVGNGRCGWTLMRSMKSPWRTAGRTSGSWSRMGLWSGSRRRYTRVLVLAVHWRPRGRVVIPATASDAVPERPGSLLRSVSLSLCLSVWSPLSHLDVCRDFVVVRAGRGCLRCTLRLIVVALERGLLRPRVLSSPNTRFCLRN